MTTLAIIETYSTLSIQDLGRPGLQHWAITEGGAADREGFLEGCAILGQPTHGAAIEWLGMGGRFRLEGGMARAVLTGAAFKAQLDGQPVEPAVSFLWQERQELLVQGSGEGNYGYLHLGGGFDVPEILGARATHLRAGFGGFHGRALRAGDQIPIGDDDGDAINQTLADRRCLTVQEKIRILWSVQVHRFREDERRRFLETEFSISSRLDRMGVQLDTEATAIEVEDGRGGLSDAVLKGDIQISGEGRATVLLADHQPTGGYPRIATVITADHDRIAQRPPGTRFQFELIDQKSAVDILRAHKKRLDALPSGRITRTRDPKDVPDLLSYELATAVAEPEEWKGS